MGIRQPIFGQLKMEKTFTFLTKLRLFYRVEIGISAKKNSEIVKINLNILECKANDKSFSQKKEIILKSISIKLLELKTSLNKEKYTLRL